MSSGMAPAALNLSRITSELAARGLRPSRSNVRRICGILDLSAPDAAFALLTAGGGPLVREAQASVALDKAEIGTRSASDAPAACPTSPLPEIEVVEVDTEAPFAVFSDLHVPAHDAGFIDRCLRICRKLGVADFAIIGDLTDGNQWHSRTHGIRTTRRWQDDIDLTRSILSHICSSFPGRGWVMLGNHDAWMEKAAAGQFDLDWLYSYLFPMLPITYVEHRQMRVVQCSQPFRLLHGEHFSHSNPFKVLESYAYKYRENVIMGHQHYAGLWRSAGLQLVMNGGMFDAKRMEYLHREPKNYRSTQRGFTIIDDGQATLFEEEDFRW